MAPSSSAPPPPATIAQTPSAAAAVALSQLAAQPLVPSWLAGESDGMEVGGGMGDGGERSNGERRDDVCSLHDTSLFIHLHKQIQFFSGHWSLMMPFLIEL